MPKPNAIQSVDRALEILEAIAAAPAAVPLKTIAQALALKPPTVHHLAATLVARGYLRKDGHGLYALGARVAELARRREPCLETLAQDRLLGLADQAPGASVVLARYMEGEVRATLEIQRDRPALASRPAAHTLHPYSSASALAFQAYWAAETLGEFRLRYPFSEFAHRLWTDLPTLDGFLTQARMAGVVCVTFPHENILKVAAPVRHPDRPIVAVVAASLPLEGSLRRSDPDTLAGMVTATAAELSSRLTA